MARFGNSNGFGDRAPDLAARLARCFPFSVDADKPAGVEQTVGREIDQFDQVLSAVGHVDGLSPAPRPLALDPHTLEREVFLGGRAGMDIVDTQGLTRRPLFESFGEHRHRCQRHPQTDDCTHHDPPPRKISSYRGLDRARSGSYSSSKTILSVFQTLTGTPSFTAGK